MVKYSCCGFVLGYSESHTSLIHEFLRFTTERHMVFPKLHCSHQLQFPWIQRFLIKTASIAPSTRILPLSALTAAQYLRIGTQPSAHNFAIARQSSVLRISPHSSAVCTVFLSTAYLTALH